MNIEEYKIKLAREKKLKRLPKTVELNLLEGRKLISKPMRTQSGVAPVAIMVKPRKCPHGSCSYCCGGPNSFFGSVPKSYTGKEPASLRARRNKYDAYLQIFNRLEHYVLLQQIPEKVELIIMGGTFLAYPKSYQESFVMNAFKAMNDFSKLFFVDGNLNLGKFKEFFEFGLDFKSEERTRRLLEKISKLKRKGKSELEKEQRKNEKAKIRCCALVIETRPDYCREEHVKQALKLGCTRMELGVQSLDDSVLEKVNRGHGIKESVEATQVLKDSFIKTVFHCMLGLPNSTKQKDIIMFREMFENPNYKPDGLKIYPCMVMPGTKLYEDYKNKKFKPLNTKEAIEIISEGKKFIPEYCRVYRIQRDIGTKYTVAGVDKTNLRQYIKTKCRCIRCREPRNKKISWKDVKLIRRGYEASKGKEIFLSFEDAKNDIVLGFLRLRINDKVCGIREMHVYGSAVRIGGRGGKGEIQHRGLGKKLLKEAERIAKEEFGKKKIKIISGIGVREYFRKLGYRKEGWYMVKAL